MDVAEPNEYSAPRAGFEKSYKNGKEDKIPTTIRNLLADLTWPLSLRPSITALVEELYVGEGLSPEVRRERIEQRVQREFRELTNRTSMIRFRRKAEDLAARYEEVAEKGYEATDSYFLREATKLHEQMQAYASDYFDYHRDVEINPFTGTTDDVIRKIQATIKKLSDKEQAKKGDSIRTSSPEVKLFLSRSEEYDSNDGERIKFKINSDGSIQTLIIDEFFDPRIFCMTLDQLAEAQTRGAQLSSQQQLVSEFQDHPPTNPSQIHINPLELLYRSIPPLLAEKIRGHCYVEPDVGGFGSRNYIPVETGPLRFTTLIHGGEAYQSTLDLNTKSFTTEEIYQLIGHYIDTLRAFPRIPKVLEQA